MRKIQFFNPVPSPHKLLISQVGVAGDFLYTWGYGEVIRKGHEREDMRKVFEHIKACLAAKGLGFADVVKVTALLTDLVRRPALMDPLGSILWHAPPPRDAAWRRLSVHGVEPFHGEGADAFLVNYGTDLVRYA